MILTTKQALSFVEATSKSAPKHFFDALLGAGQTPKVEDFMTDDAERLDKAEEFLDCVQSVTDALVEHIRNQPRQKSLLAGFDAEVKGFKPTVDDGKPIHEKPEKKKPEKKKVVSSMKKFKEEIGKKKRPAKKKPAKKGAKR